MKKYTLPLCLSLFVLVGASSDTVGYSTEYTADALVRTGEAHIYGIVIATDGTNAVTLDIHDGTTVAGSTIMPTTVIPTSATQRSGSIGFDPPVMCNDGIYVNITTAGTLSYTVYYNASSD